MVLCLEAKFGWLAPAADFRVVFLGVARRYILGEQVGHAELDVAQRLLHVLERALPCLESVAKILDGGEQRFDVLALRLGLANTLCARIAFAL